MSDYALAVITLAVFVALCAWSVWFVVKMSEVDE